MNKKLTELPQITSTSSNDLVLIDHYDQGAYTTSAINITNLAQQVNSVPPGAVFWFAGANAPTGYLLCNGQLLNRAGTYYNLFLAIGTYHNTGGETPQQFRVPNLIDKFIRGVDGVRPVGNIQTPYAGHNKYTTIGGDGDDRTGPYYTKDLAWLNINDVDAFNASQNVTPGIVKTTNINVIPGDTRPINMALLPCIKY